MKKEEFVTIPGYTGKDMEVEGGTVRIHNCGSSRIYVNATWTPKRIRAAHEPRKRKTGISAGSK